MLFLIYTICRSIIVLLGHCKQSFMTLYDQIPGFLVSLWDIRHQWISKEIYYYYLFFSTIICDVLKQQNYSMATGIVIDMDRYQSVGSLLRVSNTRSTWQKHLCLGHCRIFFSIIRINVLAEVDIWILLYVDSVRKRSENLLTLRKKLLILKAKNWIKHTR